MCDYVFYSKYSEIYKRILFSLSYVTIYHTGIIHEHPFQRLSHMRHFGKRSLTQQTEHLNREAWVQDYDWLAYNA
jgi:hypothetical protein